MNRPSRPTRCCASSSGAVATPIDCAMSRHTSGVAALAAATLLLESTLTRLLSVAQFYHFAFLVISLALLGLGASGTFLPVLTQMAREPSLAGLQRLLAWSAAGFAASVVLAYAVVTWLPFDSYAI